MKALILFSLLTTQALASTWVDFNDAPKFEQDRLTKFLLSEDYINNASEARDSIDDYDMSVRKVSCKVKGEVKVFDYIKIYMGDTQVGPLFEEGTDIVVGENGDGDFYLGMYDYVECYEIKH